MKKDSFVDLFNNHVEDVGVMQGISQEPLESLINVESRGLFHGYLIIRDRGFFSLFMVIR